MGVSYSQNTANYVSAIAHSQKADLVLHCGDICLAHFISLVISIPL